MGDSTSKKILDSALSALLAGVEISPWVKVPTTFVKELSTRIKSLPDEDQAVLVSAEASAIERTIQSTASVKCDEPQKLSESIVAAGQRSKRLDYLYKLSNPAIDELITRFEAVGYVTKDAPKRRKISEFVEWVESPDGPEGGLEAIPINFPSAR